MNPNDRDFERFVTEALEHTDSEVSDIEDRDLDNNYYLESDHDTSSEISVTESQEQVPSDDEDSDDEPLINIARNRPYYLGKKVGKRVPFKWYKDYYRRNVRNQRHNIVRIQGSNNARDCTEEIDFWNILLTEDILQITILHTNKKLQEMRQKYKNLDRPELKDIDDIEMRALIGCLIFTAIFKSNKEDIASLFSTTGKGREIFRCNFSQKRFLVLLAALRFDDPNTREERKKTDPATIISGLYDIFISNCQKYYTPGTCMCIDEMLVKCRCRCKFLMYMPKKPGKYGLKLMCMTDAATNYLYNAYIYCGKDTDGQGLTDEEQEFSKPTQSIIRLSKPVHNTGRNITADNWFTSIEAVKLLLNKGLTYVGTVNKKKREIPPEFQPSKLRLVGQTLYGFTKEITMISYVPKHNKAVVLVSSMHHDNCDDIQGEKPEIILYYNSTKNGVDGLDKMCSNYSCIRRTKRWPLVLFYRMIDICAVNSYVLYKDKNPEHAKKVDRYTYLSSVADQLCKPHMLRRYYNQRLPRDIRASIKRILKIEDTDTVPSTSSKLEKRGTCSICPAKKKKRTQYMCKKCRKPACLDCLEKICVLCYYD